MIIELQNITLTAHLKKHYPSEVSDMQDIAINIIAEYFPQEEFPTKLSDVIDYVKIEDLVIDIVKTQQFEIIEHLGNEICTKILEKFSIINKISTKITKNNVLKSTKSVSIVIEKSQNVHKIVLSLGSNLGDRIENLKSAYNQLCDKLKLKNAKISSIYETNAWFPDESYPKDWNIPYYNIAISGLTEFDVNKILAICQEIEILLGRAGDHAKFSPRIIDIDILYFDGKIIANSNLQVPHSQIFFRDFMLIPAKEIENDLFITDIENNARIVYKSDIFDVK